MSEPTYIVQPSRSFPDILTITCLLCGRKSYNINDVEQRYCGYCHHFHEGEVKLSLGAFWVHQNEVSQ